jgi:hypothetical protein
MAAINITAVVSAASAMMQRMLGEQVREAERGRDAAAGAATDEGVEGRGVEGQRDGSGSARVRLWCSGLARAAQQHRQERAL